MARRRGNTFNFLQANSKADDFSVKPIKAEFGGSLPSSIYRINSASSWSRWRRGFEIATASYYQNTIDFPFTYKPLEEPSLSSYVDSRGISSGIRTFCINTYIYSVSTL